MPNIVKSKNAEGFKDKNIKPGIATQEQVFL
jgi:hypothetical protein